MVDPLGLICPLCNLYGIRCILVLLYGDIPFKYIRGPGADPGLTVGGC